jgi:peptidyl-prolyl cis-trans isomerase B (cyclophilin B)
MAGIRVFSKPGPDGSRDWKLRSPPRALTWQCRAGMIRAGELKGAGWQSGSKSARDKMPFFCESLLMNDEVAVIKTTQGEMVVKFWPEVAPKTVENFKTLAKKGFYDGTAFHRIVKGFMIQGGDPNTKDLDDVSSYGTGGPGHTIKAEFNDRSHKRGVLSMARSNDPDSAGSQFFICLGDASFLDRKYTAFGELIKGDDVLGKIGDAPVGMSGGGERSRPAQRIQVESIRIVPADSVK